jgi:hypothetical protein
MSVRLTPEQRAEIAGYAVYFATDAIETVGLADPSNAFEIAPSELVDLFDRLRPHVELVREVQTGVEVTQVDALREVATWMKEWMLGSAMDDADRLAESGDVDESIALEDIHSLLARADLASEVLEVVG